MNQLLPPWWWVRWRAAGWRERLWRARPATRPRPCPPGPDPRWPWALPTPPPVSSRPAVEGAHDEAGPVPPLRPRGGRWPADPKPWWRAHRLWPLLTGPAGAWRRRVDTWWRHHGSGGAEGAAASGARSPLLWASPHAVATRVPPLIAAGHREALWAHADHLARHPSRFSSAANHRVAELAALWLVQQALPDAPWVADELPQVLAAQLHPDGWPREQSLAYLAHVLEWGALAYRARAHPDLRHPLATGLATLRRVLHADGTAPRLGDDGGDEVLPGRAPYAGSVAGLVAAVLGASPPPGWQPDARTAWLGLSPHAGPVRPTPRDSHCFPDGGLTVLCAGGTRVLFDHGPLGMAPLAGHGHADALALWLALDGQPVFGGRGTSTYHQHPRRELERGSLGSSTLTLAGRGSAVPHRHPFLWHTQVDATLDHLRLSPTGGEVAAHHLGWQSELGIVPHRHVQLSPGRLSVTDHLRGQGRHLLTRRWHLAPGWQARVDGRRATLRHGARRLTLHTALPMRAQRTEHAPRYGALEPAVTLVEEAPVTAPGSWCTTFAWP